MISRGNDFGDSEKRASGFNSATRIITCKNDRAEDLVIEKRVPVIFTVVGVENDTRFLINMFRISIMRICMISYCPPNDIN